MQLYLDSYGAFLGIRNGMFWVKPRHHDGQALAVRQVKAIFLTKGVRVSSDALMLAIREAIPVLIIDGIGHPVGQVWSGQFGSIGTIRKNQALFANDAQGMDWIRSLLIQKIDQQDRLLRDLGRKKDIPAEFSVMLERTLVVLQNVRDRFAGWRPSGASRSEDAAATFRGWEGTATRLYFQCLSLSLPPQYRFEGRSRRPAYDAFNALLNYLYGMLYAMVELAQMKAGLDPYTGVLHADQYKRPTLVYDVIECYRCWAETVAVDLCRRSQLPEDAFSETESEGVWLDRSGKSVVIDSFLAFLDKKIEYKGQLRKRITHIDLDALRLASDLKSFSTLLK